MQHCSCRRKIQVSPGFDPIGSLQSTEGAEYAFANTTCSRDAFERGPGQKVVGFAFYGNPNADIMRAKGYFQVGRFKQDIN